MTATARQTRSEDNRAYVRDLLEERDPAFTHFIRAIECIIGAGFALHSWGDATASILMDQARHELDQYTRMEAAT